MSRDVLERRLLAVVRPAFIAFLLVITLFPFYYMVMLSFRPLDAVLQDPGALWPQPGEIDLGTYRDVLASTADGGQGFLNFIKNSMLVAIGTVVLSLLVAIPGAYAVSRLEFFGRRQIGAVFLGVYFFPSILLAIPLFVFFTRIQQRGTLTGLLIVYVAQVAAVSIYMLRNYFDTIPASHRSLRKNSTMIGRVRITEPAMSTVVGTSMLPASWERPRDTVQLSRRSTRNSRAKRNSFQAIMNTNNPLATMAGIASGRLIRHITPRRVQPSKAADSSRLCGMVSK